MNHTNKVLKLILEQPEIHPNDILYALFLCGVTPSKVAQECDCKPQTVSQVVHGKVRSANIATYIAMKLGTSTHRLWGDTYNYTPKNSANNLRRFANG